MKTFQPPLAGTTREERGLQAAARGDSIGCRETPRNHAGRFCGLKAALLLALALSLLPHASAQTVATNKVAEPKKAAEADPNEEPVNWITVGVGGVSTSGNRAQFQERWGRKQGVLGGLQDFHYELMFGQKGMLELDGQAMYGGEDYSVKLQVVDPDRGFFRAGFRQFKTWYDGSAGYVPATGGFISLGSDELSLRRGEIWVEGGLTPPDGPMLTLKLSREYRKGTKDSIIWGDSTQGGVTRGMVPSFREINEIRNRVLADLRHTVGRSDFGIGFRLDMADTDNKFKERRTPEAAGVGNRFVTQRDVFESDMFNVRAFTETRFNDRTLLTSGYSYTRLDTDIGGSRIYGASFDAPYSPAYVDSGYTSLSGGSIVDQYVMNLSLRWEPFADFVVVPSLRAEKIDTGDSSQYSVANVPTGITSVQSGFLTVSEALEARFTGFTNWVLYARGEWSEGDGYLREQSTPVILRNTDSERFTQKYTVGANWYPLRRLHFSGQYYHKTVDNDYTHLTDSTANTLVAGNRYPAFLREHSFQTDDLNLRATWRPLPNVTSVTRYDYQVSTINTRGDNLGNVESGKTTAHIVSQNLTWAPWSRLLMQGSFSYALDSTTTPASSITGTVTDARNDYWQATATVTFIVDDKTDLLANYFYYRANNFINNSSVSMPYGTSANDHTVSIGLTRNFSKTVRGSLNYGYFRHRDETSGGFDNYDAHLVFSTITYRF
ncbi:MAG: hypothetical protein FD161_3108 [Limisphaerales bacterium]|nr:MAG: hypothetical protein FD161_3108 [Limisphaerales bacterium]KAG0508017.1 MAG: hypothetical protein E1N63_2815 [Limisphaerales bacterium]TXT50448.1 MAG: hypothetical protein FD140_2371 [Limisphaerales bacterium]